MSPRPAITYWVLSPLFSAMALKWPRNGGPIPKLPREAIFSKELPQNTPCNHMEGLFGAVLGPSPCRQRGQGTGAAMVFASLWVPY